MQRYHDIQPANTAAYNENTCLALHRLLSFCSKKTVFQKRQMNSSVMALFETNAIMDFRARRMEYFRSMAAGSTPTAAVIEDVDYPNCITGWWGEVHVAVHKGPNKFRKHFRWP